MPPGVGYGQQSIRPDNRFQQIDEISPLASFYQGIGQPGAAMTPAGSFMREQFNPYFNTFRFNQLLSGNTSFDDAIGGGTAFNEFNRGNNLADVRRMAGSQLGQIGRGNFNNPEMQQLFQNPDDDQAGALGQLAMTGLAGRVSPLALGLLNFPTSGADLRAQHIASNGVDANDFMGFLNRRFGLGRGGLTG